VLLFGHNQFSIQIQGVIIWPKPILNPDTGVVFTVYLEDRIFSGFLDAFAKFAKSEY
jgi:hypothetical protein